ncbi:YcgN family cysteine cluster protein [Thermodesulfobacteriota bacterium]
MTPFWKNKKLKEMTRYEWESLCDGCARCCLHKMEDEETGVLYYTRIVCRYLEEESCRCLEYGRRTQLVPTCIQLQPDNLGSVYFMPQTCAYRLLAEGSQLPPWHPLVSGDRESVSNAGISVRGQVISEEFVHPEGWHEHVIDWIS